MKTKTAKTGFETKFHRDHTVTVWDVYAQSWTRTARPADHVLASLETNERTRVMKHCGIGK